MSAIATATSEWKIPGALFEITHYLLRGKNPESLNQQLVVFVHGIGDYHTTWNFMAEHFMKAGFMVLQFDLIGRGFSLPPSNCKYGEEEHIGQLHDLLQGIAEQLPPPPYHFVCHSMGGAIGAIFASRYPQFIRSLTLLSPAGLMGYFPLGLLHSVGSLQHVIKPLICNEIGQRNAWKAGFYQHKGESLKIENKYIADWTLMYQNNPGATDAFWKSALEFPMRNIDGHIQNLGRQNQFPIYLLWAKKDTAVPYHSCYKKWVNYLQSNEKNPEITCHFQTKVYKKAAHAFQLEFPTIVNQDILQFLQSIQ